MSLVLTRAAMLTRLAVALVDACLAVDACVSHLTAADVGVQSVDTLTTMEARDPVAVVLVDLTIDATVAW